MTVVNDAWTKMLFKKRKPKEFKKKPMTTTLKDPLF